MCGLALNYTHALWMQAAGDLASLRICTDSPENSLLANAIRTETSCPSQKDIKFTRTMAALIELILHVLNTMILERSRDEVRRSFRYKLKLLCW